MYPNIPSGITLAKVIGGLSKSLTIANQVIPIYQQLSPMVKNARKAFGALREMSANTPLIQDNNVSVNKKRTIINSSNNPSFFQ